MTWKETVCPINVWETQTTNKTHECVLSYHDDVVKWEYFPLYYSFVRGNRRSPAPLTKASDAEHWCFLWYLPTKAVEQTSRSRWFETPSRSLSRHCNVMWEYRKDALGTRKLYCIWYHTIPTRDLFWSIGTVRWRIIVFYIIDYYSCLMFCCVKVKIDATLILRDYFTISPVSV